MKSNIGGRHNRRGPALKILSQIRERMYARCPFGKAPSYLNHYLDGIARDSGGRAGIIHLKVSLADLGLPSGLAIVHDVEACYEPVTETEYGSHDTHIAWAPVGGGPYPSFSGLISIEADETYGSSSLIIEGEYAPPLGLVGKAFDAIVGRRIAEATARELLLQIRASLEAESRKSEGATSN